MTRPYKYLFGPVPSRRLGRSLGVDLTPFKTCTMNCRFCQLGDSAGAVTERKEYVPTSDVLAELTHWKQAGGQADHITLAGSGEPTLHSGFGEILRWIKENTAIPSVLLSNGSLFFLPEVRSAATWADKVKLTLSAWDEESFQRLHHPAPSLSFTQLVAGERAFRQEFSGELSLEVFVVAGINSSPDAARNIAAIAKTIAPDRIDLNTAVRPPAHSDVKAATAEQLTALAPLFTPKAHVTASFKSAPAPRQTITSELLTQLILRHPSTAEQLAREFNAPQPVVETHLAQLVTSGHLRKETRAGETYYFYRAPDQ